MPDTLALSGLFGFSLGIAIGSLYVPPLAAVLFFLLLALIGLGAWFWGRRDVYVFPAVFLLLFALGAWHAGSAFPQLPPALAASLDAPVTLTGTVIADPDMRESSQHLLVAVPGTRILVTTDPYGTYAYGDTVTVAGTLAEAQPFETDGGRSFDYRRFLAKDGIAAVIGRGQASKVDAPVPLAMRPLRFLLSGKHAFAHALEDALPEPYASLAEGLITGGKQGLGDGLIAFFTRAGLLPIVVLSGYNVMIVAELVLASFRRLRRSYAAGAAGLAIILFVLAAGGGASAWRAAVMAALAVFAKASGRTYDALRALFLTFAVMLVLSPLSLLYDPGFQFSFMAAFGLILLSGDIERRIARLPKFLRETCAATLAAQLFVLPLLLYQTGQLSLVAVMANLLALPIVPLAMALSALAGIAGLVAPPIAVFAGLPAYVLLWYLVEVATIMGGVPFASFVVPVFPALLLVPAYALIAWFTARIRKTAPSGAVSRS